MPPRCRWRALAGRRRLRAGRERGWGAGKSPRWRPELGGDGGCRTAVSILPGWGCRVVALPALPVAPGGSQPGIIPKAVYI